LHLSAIHKAVPFPLPCSGRVSCLYTNPRQACLQSQMEWPERTRCSNCNWRKWEACLMLPWIKRKKSATVLLIAFCDVWSNRVFSREYGVWCWKGVFVASTLCHEAVLCIFVWI